LILIGVFTWNLTAVDEIKFVILTIIY
jgi:hypothetical protein